MKQPQRPRDPLPARKRSPETVQAHETVVKKILAPPVKKEKKRFSSEPSPNSKRSKQRRARGFQTLNLSSRKHRRAASRMIGNRGAVNYDR